MLSEWSAECSADDPVLVVPWSDPSDPSRRFIDLRENPYDLDHLPEAEHYPPLMHALRALNASRSPVFTAKSDAWPLDPDELDALRIHLSIQVEEAPAGFASYIDLLSRERSLFASFHLQEQLLRPTHPLRRVTGSPLRHARLHHPSCDDRPQRPPRRASPSASTSKPSATTPKPPSRPARPPSIPTSPSTEAKSQPSPEAKPPSPPRYSPLPNAPVTIRRGCFSRASSSIG